MLVKHNKFKNSGLLFELLVRQITSDTLSGNDSPAVNILKKYFVKTELGKEYKLYDTVLKQSSLSEAKANMIIDEVLKASHKLNRTTLKKEKYNLISEIKKLSLGVDDKLNILSKARSAKARLFRIKFKTPIRWCSIQARPTSFGRLKPATPTRPKPCWSC